MNYILTPEEQKLVLEALESCRGQNSDQSELYDRIKATASRNPEMNPEFNRKYTEILRHPHKVWPYREFSTGNITGFVCTYCNTQWLFDVAYFNASSQRTLHQLSALVRL